MASPRTDAGRDDREVVAVVDRETVADLRRVIERLADHQPGAPPAAKDDRVEKVCMVVLGNGEPGLVGRVREMEKELRIYRWFTAALVVSVLGFFARYAYPALAQLIAEHHGPPPAARE